MNMMSMNDVNYVKFGIHLMKLLSTKLDKAEEAIEIIEQGIFDLYANILKNTNELSIIVNLL
jgi:hypothetical protein